MTGGVYMVGDIAIAVDATNSVDFCGVAVLRHNGDGTVTVLDAREVYKEPDPIDGECWRVE